ncbi:hypothetical protein [Pseudomonas sp. BN515]|uniref:hypothetical protein n=1 Tax=Pseudomonas sp. BN515 TaxID=2567892 RepID=UPI00245532F2|nr:hypothetical protein [Pseudomonas sp. BN515]MDH4871988.1 hypothetical protein [Pseudomonas sp. BN515]
MVVPLQLLTPEEQDLLIRHGVSEGDDVPKFAQRLCELFLDRIVGRNSLRHPGVAHDPSKGD